MKKFSQAVIVLAIMGIVGFAATSFAGWGRGGGACWDQGPGWSQRGYGPSGYQNNLSDDEIDKLNKERQAFFEDTRELRQNLYQKELELRSELAKKDPDAKTAVSLQKQISELESQLNQKSVEQRLKMQKENPDFYADRGYGQGRGYGMGRRYGMGGGGMGRGYGMGQGYGMGRGFQGQGGGCWD